MLFHTSKTSKRFLKQAKQAVNVIVSVNVSVSVSVNENVIEDENETEYDSVYADEEEDVNVVFSSPSSSSVYTRLFSSF